MSVEEHEVFRRPGDPRAVIWRYLDLAKYLAMIQDQALYFSRLDQLGDPFEGSVPRATIDEEVALEERVFRELKGLADSEKAKRLAAMRRTKGRLGRAMTRWCAVNCWHRNQHESAAMWDVYVKSGAGVAIRSTVERLVGALGASTQQVYVGEVQYLDYARDGVSRGNLLTPVMTKRLSFEHERELRAVVCEFFITNGELDFDGSAWTFGTNVAVDLHHLVERIHVAPSAPAWFANVVRTATARHGFEWEVVQSSLVGEPLF